MQIAVVGLGLIGGSFCKSIKKYTSHTCWGLDEDEFILQQAAMEGAIDGVITAQQLGQADLTIVCLHPQTAIDFLLRYKEQFRPGSVVMDTCGVKQAIVDAVEGPLKERGVHFLGAHPMAGREFSGYDYALADLYQGASFIVTPDAELSQAVLTMVEELAKALGFAQVVKTTPKMHDQTIAFTSQLAHVVSNAYIKSPTLQNESGFSAGSFLDLTRVAKLNEKMWTELFLMNKTALLFELDNIMSHLAQYRTALAEGDSRTLQQLLKDGRLLKEESLEAHR